MISDLRSHFKKNNGLFVKCSPSDDLAKILVFFQTSSFNSLYIVVDDADVFFSVLSKQFTIIEAAGGLVTNSAGDVLLINRNGMWDLPKGKVEKGEATEQAAVREVEEECGISPLELNDLITVTYHTYNLNSIAILKPTYWYRMQYLGGAVPSPQVDEGITEVRWVAPNMLSPFVENTYPSIRDVFASVGLV